MSRQPSVVIIGAGMAGLSAAEYLLTSGLRDVKILEASDRYGGRMRTGNFGEGIIELGANWIHGATLNNSIYLLAAQNKLLDPYVLLDRMEGYCYTSKGKVIDRHLSQKVWDMFGDINEDLNQNSHNTNETFGTLLENKIHNSLHEFPIQERSQARAVFNCLLNLERFHDGASLDDVSVRQTQAYEELPGGEVKLPHGCRALLDNLVKRLPVGTVKYNMEVCNLDYSGSQTRVRCQNGEVFSADHVIVTSSLGYLKRHLQTLFTPHLPIQKVAVIENMGFGCVNKIFLYYENPFWVRGKGGIKLCWSEEEVSDHSVNEWYKKIFAFDEVLNNPGVLVAWVSGDEAAYMESLPVQQVADDCSKVIKMFLGNPHLPEPTKVIRSTWRSEPYICGSYSFMATGNYSLQDMQEPLTGPDGTPKLLFAGEATHPRFFSTMHGARSSGLREAGRILKLYKPSSKL